ncbi:MAG: hypothetical protein E7486_03845 [Ruminococcaceae bacterium]|nr:hypothetical protein [Oscillospiraceae bacterium]
MFHEDWFLRQVEMYIHAIAQIVFGKKSPRFEQGERVSLSPDDLHYLLLPLLEEGRYCEAEDLLFEAAGDGSDLSVLETGLDFYSRLNTLTDSQLEAGSFSREEIREGLDDLLRIHRFDPALFSDTKSNPKE